MTLVTCTHAKHLILQYTNSVMTAITTVKTFNRNKRNYHILLNQVPIIHLPWVCILNRYDVYMFMSTNRATGTVQIYTTKIQIRKTHHSSTSHITSCLLSLFHSNCIVSKNGSWRFRMQWCSNFCIVDDAMWFRLQFRSTLIEYKFDLKQWKMSIYN